MATPAVIDTLTSIAAPVAASLGLEIWGIEITQAGRAVVRIFVDVPADAQGVNLADDAEGGTGAPLSASIDQCEEISRHVGLTLEVEDVIPTAYVLEVSSPGLTRTLFRPEQLRRFMGDVIEASLTDPLPELGNRRRFRGVLCSAAEESFVLDLCAVSPEGEVALQGQQVTLPWGACRKVVRQHIFVQPAKPGKGKKKAAPPQA